MDLDDVCVEEMLCVGSVDCIFEFLVRNFILFCLVYGWCEGMNEKWNFYNVYRFFFIYFLFYSVLFLLCFLLDSIVNVIGEFIWGVDEILVQLEKVLYLYWSGQYLQNFMVSSSIEYQCILDSIIFQEDYCCWLFYYYGSCFFLVFNLVEVVDVCESYVQCWVFVVINQIIWIG